MRTDSRVFTFFLASIAALTSLSIDMSLPAVPAIEREFGQAAGSGGLTVSLFLAGYALTPLVGGPLADRLGRRRVLLTSLTCFALSALMCGLSRSFTMLLVFRLLQGSASGVATTLPLAIVRDLLEGSAARQRISEVTTINSIMPVVAPVVGSWTLLFGGWRSLFTAQALFAGGIALAFVLHFEETLPRQRRRGVRPGALLRTYWQLLTNRIFFGYAVINALGFACIFSFISASPLILMQRMGVSHRAYPVMFSGIAGGTILGAFGSALLNRSEVPVRRILVCGLALMTCASLTALALFWSGYARPVTILPPVFAALLGFGLISPSVTVEAMAPIPHLAGSGSGALRSILMVVGSGSSALLATYCSRHLMYSDVATTLTMSVTALGALVMYGLMPVEASRGNGRRRALKED